MRAKIPNEQIETQKRSFDSSRMRSKWYQEYPKQLDELGS